MSAVRTGLVCLLGLALFGPAALHAEDAWQSQYNVIHLFRHDANRDYRSASSIKKAGVSFKGYRALRGQALVFKRKQAGANQALQLFWHAARKDSLLVANRKSILAAKRAGYKQVRTEGYIFQSKQPGTIALKQYWHAKHGDSMLVTRPEGIARARKAGYKYMHTEGYAYPYVHHGLAVRKTSPSRHRISNKLSLRNSGFQFQKLIVILGLPQSNLYQEVRNLQLTPGAEILHVPNSRTTYVRFTLDQNQAPAPGQTMQIGYDADVTLYAWTAPSRIHSGEGPVLPGDRAPIGLEKYTRSNDPFVLPEQSALANRAAQFWQASGGRPLGLARRAYQDVASRYVYRDANTGLHPLQQVLSNNGGDCGNLSSIVISMLRSRKIPARHLVGIRADGVFHAWAEFHHSLYGWMPVDVTYKNSNPAGDFFGAMAERDKAIILHEDVNLEVELESGRKYTTPILQGYLWWVYGSGNMNRQLQPAHQVQVRAL